MKLTRQCFGCKQDIRKDEMIEYSSITGKTSHWYCKDCYEERLARERFQNKVCQIFGLKSPGPLIWTQRKNLHEKYGYTDDAIIDCLDYIYNVKHAKKLVESLGLINQKSMEEMKKWRAKQQEMGVRFAASIENTKTTEEQVVTVLDKKKKKEVINLDDALLE